MKFNRNEHSRFVQWLDRTVERNPLLWLPCILLLIIAIGAEQVGNIVKTAFLRRKRACAADCKVTVQLGRKPFALRIVAMTLVMSLSFMFVPELGDAFEINVFADYETNNSDDLSIGYSEDVGNEWENDDYDTTIETYGENDIETYSDSDSVYGVFYYTISNGEVTITGYNGTGTDVVIPDTIEDLPVISIGEEAFSGDWNLIKITIPVGVTVIGKSAFKNCINLTEVTISSSVELIGEMAFWECNSLKDIVIPESVTSIGSYSFAYCQNLSNIEISNNVTYIGQGAFVWCHKLQDFAIPQDISLIEDYVFLIVII